MHRFRQFIAVSGSRYIGAPSAVYREFFTENLYLSVFILLAGIWAVRARAYLSFLAMPFLLLCSENNDPQERMS